MNPPWKDFKFDTFKYIRLPPLGIRAGYLEEAAKIAESFANCGCGRSDCYSDNIPKAIAEAIRAKAKI